MNECQKILDDNEAVLWEGTPKLLPFLLSGIAPFFIFGAFWTTSISLIGVIGSSTVSSSASQPGTEAFSWMWLIMLIPFFSIGLSLMFGLPIYRLLLHRHIHYVITSKRVIVQKGLIGRDFEFIDFDQIKQADVNVNVWDQLVGNGSGSIRLALLETTKAASAADLGIAPYVLAHVTNPYEVFKFFKKLSYDVKTDIQYPNALRPKDNPGYSTQLLTELKKTKE